MLTQKEIAQYKWTKDRLERVGKSLYLQIRKSSKTYIFRTAIKGKVNVVTIGKHPLMKLKEAKVIVNDLRSKVIKDRSITEKLRADTFISDAKVADQVTDYINCIGADLGNQDRDDVTRGLIVKLIQDHIKFIRYLVSSNNKNI